ncbi:MAG: XRE family transcriptional regulator [Mesorhizobium sp.]|uniref:helix-turn-helix domain-containing protein n=1 Tax=Mesorhizobium sp. TaxID=1871066 RepID=UPI000FE73E5E|nr:helix-turn-helix transcriptional regulator [Mesorhizobium sp.]RWK61819.1 MAG: XRE family transcriptional regulator [Mesorhizobium sp.]RWM47662.1 MAG: XRE family transcriptional regulator [Mesorhizobium sp.]RWN02394.1 MAG: XRE family transcriptional regulator [Mesorhizobium sp.]
MMDHSFELETDKAVDVVALRGELGWTQQQLADHCGVDRSTVSTWETRPPTKGPALILLRQLQASLSDAARPGGVAAGPEIPQAGTGHPHCSEAAE